MTQIFTHPSLFRIRLFTAIVSLLLSLQAVYFDDILNRDGVMYLQMVEAYLSGGLVATKAIFNWPFFSVLVAWFHQFTGISIESSAFVLSSLFFIILTDTLVRVSALLIENQRQLFIAAVLILCFPAINEYRDFIMRDSGYWAFCSLALYHFMLFCLNRHLSHALVWQAFIIIAVLFRIEGSIILLLLPLFTFYQRPFYQGLSGFFQATSLLLLSLVLGALFILNQADYSAFSKLATITNYIDLDAYASTFSSASNILASEVLNKYSDDYAGLILISGLISMMLYKLFKAFSISYAVVYLTAGWRTPSSSAQGKNFLQMLLTYFLLINLLIVTVFLLKQYFLTSRYMVMSLISLILLLSYAVSAGIEKIWLENKKLSLGLIGFALFYSLADSAIMSSSKTYIKETALWAAHNLPANSLVMTDDEFVLYYFNRDNSSSTLCVKPIYKPSSFVVEFLAKQKAHRVDAACSPDTPTTYQYFDYLIVVEKKRRVAYIDYVQTLDLKLLYRQSSKKSDQASIYRILKN